MSLLPYATGLVSLGMLLASTSHFVSVGWQSTRASLRTRGFRSRRQSRLQRESQHAHLASELSWQTTTDQPTTWRVVEVVETVDESADCRSFYLRDPLGAPLPSFRPGQFIMVRPALGGADQPTRCYSLSDAPGQPWWRITVKRQAAAPSGSVDRSQASLSRWLHRHIGAGDCLLTSDPCGEFVLDDASAGPIVLLAAGIGITPLLSMLKQALSNEPARPVHLFFQVQDGEHWPLGSTLHSWQASCPALSVTSYFSRELPDPIPPHGSVASGKFDASSVVSRTGERADAAYYICGPESWMQTLTADLQALGVASDKIHFESFGSGRNDAAPTDYPNGTNSSAPSEPWSLSFARSGLHLEPSTRSATIWKAASDNGLQLPAVCHSGACGSCRVKLLQGQVQYRTAPQCSVADGQVLACVAQPLGHVVVDA